LRSSFLFNHFAVFFSSQFLPILGLFPFSPFLTRWLTLLAHQSFAWVLNFLSKETLLINRLEQELYLQLVRTLFLMFFKKECLLLDGFEVLHSLKLQISLNFQFFLKECQFSFVFDHLAFEAHSIATKLRGPFQKMNMLQILKKAYFLCVSEVSFSLKTQQILIT